MKQHELFELLHAIAGDHFIRNAVDISEVFGRLHERAYIEVWWYGLERGPWSGGGHLMAGGAFPKSRVLGGVERASTA